MKRLLITCVFLAALCSAQTKSESGQLGGAKFRIDIPENWNHGLVIYCHGYEPKPGLVESDPPTAAVLAVFQKAGYAVAQSGYSAGGWAVEEALKDTETLRNYFARKYGAPRETYVTGHSMGGFLTVALIEKYPQAYDAGLALCGPLGPAAWFMERRVFDMRVVFDFYFPGALPSPVKVPSVYSLDDIAKARLERILDSKPEQAAAVRKFSGVRTNKELADTLVFWTFILKDLQQRSHGNPFDNHNTIYEGSPDDNALNDGVSRYAADPGATDYLQRYYTPSGKIEHPVLAIHTTYDPLVPPWVTDAYSLMTKAAGKGSFFVQQYVKHAGHCEITAPEVERGFAALRQWKNTGGPPTPGGLQ
jgi:pimeloyl-ACP methyl ester carboxylesterase